MTRHITVHLNPRRHRDRPDLKEVWAVVSPQIRHAAEEASRALRQRNIRHALVGGLAVGAYGYPRATKDVDFLVGDEAFEKHAGGIVTFREGVPIAVGGIETNVVSVAPDEPFLQEVLAHPPVSEGLPVVPIEALVYMKLAAGRRRDQHDVAELVVRGADVAQIRRYLEMHAPDLLTLFESIVTAEEG